MKLLQNISLASKLTGIILLVTIFALLSGLTIYTLNAVKQIKNDFKNSMVVNANLIGEYSISPIMFNDKQGAKDILDKLQGIPEIQHACIFDTTGQIFAKYFASSDSNKVPDYKPFNHTEFTDEALEIYRPITMKGEPYGTIYLNVSTNLLADKINDQLYLLISILVGILLLSWILATRMQALISKPLLRLASATEEVSKKEDYSVRVKRKSHDEIGILYDQFNKLVEQLEVRKKQQQIDEAALRSSEAKYRNLFENSLVGMYRTEVETGKLIDANEAIIDILGLKDVESTSLIDHYVDPADRRKIKEIVLEKGYVDNYEVQLRRTDGKKIWASISGRLFDQNKYFEGVLQDITESKQNYIKLKKANFELDSFVYHASHDLRSPLLSILGLINLSKHEDDPKKLHEFMDMIRESIAKLDNLISDLLVLSRDNRINDAIRPINLEKQIRECIKNYDFLEKFRQIQIHVSVNEAQPLVSDLTRITIILNNLISNAIKYHRIIDNDPYINIKADIDASQCKLIVEDNGEGIPEEYLPQIFDMFYRASQNAEGSGLGLYIVRNVLDKLHGEIEIESEVNKGTRFIITIPNQVMENAPVPSTAD
ncbi:MAG: ATP-binding protein [Fulvivirga sp.]|nr:ATP-binding protein [Fulvivirga sp.]